MSTVIIPTPQTPLLISHDSATPEPLEGSVVLVHGRTGTAWQRWYSDSLWHAAGSRRGLTWEQLHQLGLADGVALLYDTQGE